jgi:hypothetical protein
MGGFRTSAPWKRIRSRWGRRPKPFTIAVVSIAAKFICGRPPRARGKLSGVEPHAYLADVLTKIVNGHLNSALDELLPWAFVAAEPLKAVA